MPEGDRHSRVRALFLTDGIDAPGSRFRAEQFFPHLEERGIACTLRYAYGHRYNAIFQTALARPYQVAARAKRGAFTLGAARYDVAFLQRTALPQSAIFERAARAMGAKLVFDFDDAIYMTPKGGTNALRKRAFEAALSYSDHVIAGNDHLAAIAGVPEKTTVIPTVIDTDTFDARPFRERDEVVIGWMGTAGNFPALRMALPAIRRVLASRANARFVLVSNGRLPELEGVDRVEQRSWSRRTERDDLADFDVGVMPLIDDEWSRGKCGFKMIQYMASGRPVVASAVGANVSILEGSGAGALVRSGDEWERELLARVDDAGMRRREGEKARARAVSRYSVRAVVDELAGVLRRIAES